MRAADRDVRVGLRDLLATRPALAKSAGTVAQLLGARTLGAKLRQLSTDLVSVEVPRDALGGRQVRVKLPGRVGRDQIATALRDDGWDGFEPPMPTVFAACAATFPGIVYDVGANTGFYSAIAARAHKANRVYAFEPFPPVLDHLRSTLRVNRCGARVVIAPIAVGGMAGTASLYVPVQDHGLVETSATLSASFKEVYGDVLEVPVITLDSFEREPHPARVTILKIDVESLEAEVLKGAVQLLRTHRPLVFCEVLPKGDALAIDRLRQSVNYLDVQLHRGHAEIGGAVRFDSEGWNHLFVPLERRQSITELLARCGLRVDDVD